MAPHQGQHYWQTINELYNLTCDTPGMTSSKLIFSLFSGAPGLAEPPFGGCPGTMPSTTKPKARYRPMLEGSNPSFSSSILSSSCSIFLISFLNSSLWSNRSVTHLLVCPSFYLTLYLSHFSSSHWCHKDRTSSLSSLTSFSAT